LHTYRARGTTARLTGSTCRCACSPRQRACTCAPWASGHYCAHCAGHSHRCKRAGYARRGCTAAPRRGKSLGPPRRSSYHPAPRPVQRAPRRCKSLRGASAPHYRGPEVMWGDAAGIAALSLNKEMTPFRNPKNKRKRTL
jgi:hypothetical protein